MTSLNISSQFPFASDPVRPTLLFFSLHETLLEWVDDTILEIFRRLAILRVVQSVVDFRNRIEDHSHAILIADSFLANPANRLDLARVVNHIASDGVAVLTSQFVSETGYKHKVYNAIFEHHSGVPWLRSWWMRRCDKLNSNLRHSFTLPLQRTKNEDYNMKAVTLLMSQKEKRSICTILFADMVPDSRSSRKQRTRK